MLHNATVNQAKVHCHCGTGLLKIANNHGCRKCELGKPSLVHIGNFSCRFVFIAKIAYGALKISWGLCPSPQI